MLVSGLGELHLEILRDRIELEYNIKSTLGKMRVAYRETVGSPVESELELEKAISGQNMYAKIKMRLSTSIDEVDVAEMQKQKFESSSVEQEETSKNFSLNEDLL